MGRRCQAIVIRTCRISWSRVCWREVRYWLLSTHYPNLWSYPETLRPPEAKRLDELFKTLYTVLEETKVRSPFPI
jgi:hypothetical protein